MTKEIDEDEKDFLTIWNDAINGRELPASPQDKEIGEWFFHEGRRTLREKLKEAKDAT